MLLPILCSAFGFSAEQLLATFSSILLRAASRVEFYANPKKLTALSLSGLILVIMGRLTILVNARLPMGPVYRVPFWGSCTPVSRVSIHRPHSRHLIPESSPLHLGVPGCWIYTPEEMTTDLTGQPIF